MSDTRSTTSWQEDPFSSSARLARGMDPYRLALGLRILSWIVGVPTILLGVVATFASGIKGAMGLIAALMVVAVFQVLSKLLVIAADQRLMLWTLNDRMAAPRQAPKAEVTADETIEAAGSAAG